jgi:hypothetical protein
MRHRKPFEIAEADDAFTDAATNDVLLPAMTGKPDMLLGHRLAVVVVTTIDGRRVGIPMGHQLVSDLHSLLSEALRMLQAPEGGSVQ